MIKILAPIYGIIGLIMAIMDSLNVIRFGLMGYQTNLCALSNDINCVNDGISKMFLFAFDVILGPILLAAEFAKLGPVGGVIALIILGFFFKGVR